MGTRNAQLYSLSGPAYRAPLYMDAIGALQTRPADNLPLVLWPGGRWCVDANRYIREQFEKGRSRRNRGGTLSIFASQISHLLRYCWSNRIDPIELTDNQFFEFIGELSSEKSALNPEQFARQSSTVIGIGRRCLDFLSSVGRHSADDNFVSINGRIRGEQRSREVAVGPEQKGRRKKNVSYWYHAAFPLASPKKVRAPIAKEYIDALRFAAIKQCHSTLAKVDHVSPSYVSLHNRDRKLVTLLLLEATGARRGEVALVTVKSVRSAQRMEYPMLAVPTLKKRQLNDPIRYVPIARNDLKIILDYIDYSRNPLLRKLLGKNQDHGFLLVSGRTGEPFTSNALTAEIRVLAKHAGLDGSASPHLFRHRFITKMFVSLIKQHDVENPETFRKMLLDVEAMKRKVLEWTGQSCISALDGYIDLAFDEIANFKKVFDIVSGSILIESAISTLHVELEKFRLNPKGSFLTAQWLKEYLHEVADGLKSLQTVRHT